jgi:hypothetical protein
MFHTRKWWLTHRFHSKNKISPGIEYKSPYSASKFNPEVPSFLEMSHDLACEQEEVCATSTLGELRGIPSLRGVLL